MKDRINRIPFGDKFKEHFLNYVDFLSKNNRTPSIEQKNIILSNILIDFDTEDEAINQLDKWREIVIENLSLN